MLLTALLLLPSCFLASAEANSAAPFPFREYCDQQGLECFEIKQLDISSKKGYSIKMSNINVDPLPITNFFQEEVSLSGEVGFTYAFNTEWGSAVVVHLPNGAYTGEIPLAKHEVLHIYPCFDREECISFGYFLEEKDAKIDIEPFERRRNLGRSMVSSTKRRGLYNSLSADCSWSKVNYYSPNQQMPTESQMFDHCGDNCHSTLDMSRFDRCALDDGEVRGAGLVFFGMDEFGDHSQQDIEDYECWIVEKCEFSYTAVFHNEPMTSTSIENADAATIVSEFNTAMMNSNLPHRLRLANIERAEFSSTPTDPREDCRDHARTLSDRTDFVQCIFPDDVRHYRGTQGSTLGAAYFPSGTDEDGISWIAQGALPSGAESGQYVPIHELGHNLGAEHNVNGDEGKGLMYKGSSLTSPLLRFFDGRNGAGKQGVALDSVVNNVQSINDYADEIASNY